MRSVEQIERVHELLRVIPEKMTNQELDELCGHLVFDDMNKLREKPFSPTSDGNDALLIMTKIELVLGSHNIDYDEEDGDNVPTPYYSAHAFISQTSVDSRRDIKEVLCMSAAKYLQQMIGFRKEWNLEEARKSLPKP